ncbi:MAG TPA: AbrB/MazE/SpoVT family DNA-binding domain-containing protein [Fimbriimonadaceae bacterium]|jgi:AbrB family looped-hinge helix DNA binding protein
MEHPIYTLNAMLQVKQVKSNSYEKYENGEESEMKCDMFYGSVTVGERGQVVIPAEARTDMGIGPGDKLLVMRHPIHKGLVIVKFDHMRDFLQEFEESLSKVKEHMQESK